MRAKTEKCKCRARTEKCKRRAKTEKCKCRTKMEGEGISYEFYNRRYDIDRRKEV